MLFLVSENDCFFFKKNINKLLITISINKAKQQYIYKNKEPNINVVYG